MAHTTLHYNTIQYTTIHYITIQYNTIHYNTIQYSTVHYNTIQYNTIQYTILYYGTLNEPCSVKLHRTTTQTLTVVQCHSRADWLTVPDCAVPYTIMLASSSCSPSPSNNRPQCELSEECRLGLTVWVWGLVIPPFVGTRRPHGNKRQVPLI